MNVIGIICEYNPFHNGHLYHIQECKKLFPDSCIILCLNGYFLQRGEVSILSKQNKVELALKYGVDLVIELPVFYGTQSADFFADAAITLLHALGITHLVFGSETTDIDYLLDLSKKQLEEKFELVSQKNLNYPTRLIKSLGENKLILPNDLLAISYLKAILKNQWNIIPVPIKRTSSYHDLEANNCVISASNIRHKREQNIDIKSYLPWDSYQELVDIDQNIYFQLLKYNILLNEHLDDYIDVTEGIEFKLKKEILKVNNIQELIENIKSKRYTYNRIQRMLTHILLGIKKEDANQAISYIHILGFNKNGQEYIKNYQKNFLLSTKVDFSSYIYQYEIRASKIYDILTHSKVSQFDSQNKPIQHK